ncbi:MAG: hypothetical protein KF791_10245 [Verrucomicrobiae bacterium]|nr:hypothetical protein [Verrucomicrobiae bacterium]
MKMYPDDWRVRLTTGVPVAACVAAAMMFWPGLLGIVVATIVGMVLGQLAGRLLFRPSSGSPPDHPPRA